MQLWLAHTCNVFRNTSSDVNILMVPLPDLKKAPLKGKPRFCVLGLSEQMRKNSSLDQKLKVHHQAAVNNQNVVRDLYFPPPGEVNKSERKQKPVSAGVRLTTEI